MNKIKLEERFWSKVDKTGECWIWLAAKQRNGYGRFRMPYGHVGAHVMSYILTNGPVPEGKEVHHKCYTRDCVRPEHLEAITHRENLLDGNTIGEGVQKFILFVIYILMQRYIGPPLV